MVTGGGETQHIEHTFACQDPRARNEASCNPLALMAISYVEVGAETTFAGITEETLSMAVELLIASTAALAGTCVA
jgi:hypothetical protein